MKYSGYLLALVFMVSACNMLFSPSQIRGRYKVDMSQLADEDEESVDGDDLGAAFGKALLGNMKFEIEFKADNKAAMHLGNGGLIEGLVQAFGDDDDKASYSEGIPMEWKTEGNDIYIKSSDDDEFSLMGTLVDHEGYQKLVIELAEDDDEKPTRLTLVKVEEKD